MASNKPLYLLDSAVLSLAPDIVWDGIGLKNVGNGSTYPVNPVGRYVVERLDAQPSIGAMAQALAQQFNIEPSTASADLREFVHDLHLHNLVSIRQSYVLESLARVRNTWYAWRTLVTLGTAVRYAYPNRRYPVTGWRVVVGCLEAHQPTACYGVIGALAAAVLIALPGALRGAAPPVDLSLYVGLLVVAYFSVLVASALLHKFAHVWAARRFGLRLTSVFVRMHTVGIAHEGGDQIKSAYVSAAGPAVTVLVLLVLAVGLWNASMFPLSGRLTVVWLLLVVALQHLPGLTPLTNDGRQAAAAIGLLARSWAANR